MVKCVKYSVYDVWSMVHGMVCVSWCVGYGVLCMCLVVMRYGLVVISYMV